MLEIELITEKKKTAWIAEKLYKPNENIILPTNPTVPTVKNVKSVSKHIRTLLVLGCLLFTMSKDELSWHPIMNYSVIAN